MQFGFLGLSYKQASLDIRDQTAFTDNKKMEFLKRIEGFGINQCMILSTCNRSELFYFYEDEQQRVQLWNCYIDFFGKAKVERFLIEYKEEEALEYLFRVTAGLESQVLGEDQILGQVKEALDFTRAMGYAKKELNRVVLNAVACAKRIKTEIKISEIPLSVTSIGIQYLDRMCGIKDARVLVIGSGKMASIGLRYLHEYGAKEIYLCSRMIEHAKEMLKEFPEIKVVEYERRYQVMQNCAIVISATASPHIILKKHEATINHEIYMLDLATPRDFDPLFKEDKRCHVFDLDTLQFIAQENKQERMELAKECQQLILEELQETYNWLRTSRMDTTIESLQQKCNEIVEDSFLYLERKMDLTKREKQLLKKTLNASLQRLIKEPIQELKQLDTGEKQEHYKEIVNHLFQIQNTREKFENENIASVPND